MRFQLISLNDFDNVMMLQQQVDGLVALMEGEHVGPFNLGNPGEFTMLELAEVCHFHSIASQETHFVMFKEI